MGIGMERQSMEDADDWAMIAFLFIFVLLATCVLVLPLRRLRPVAADVADRHRIGRAVSVSNQRHSAVDDSDRRLLRRYAISGHRLSTMAGHRWSIPLLPLTETRRAHVVCDARRLRRTSPNSRHSGRVVVGAVARALHLPHQKFTPTCVRAQSVVRGPIAWQVYLSNAFPIVRDICCRLACTWSVWVNCTTSSLARLQLHPPWQCARLYSLGTVLMAR